MSKAKTKLESEFQKDSLDRVRDMLPGCIILKNDSGYQQGIPDWLILWRDKWATLEYKAKKPTSASDFEPNQPYFIQKMNNMSFSACIYPENENEVLDALQSAFRPRRSTR